MKSCQEETCDDDAICVCAYCIRHCSCDFTLMERPKICTNEILEFLDDLQESGTINMFGAGENIRDEFNLSKKESHIVLAYWMDSFGERGVKNDQ